MSKRRGASCYDLTKQPGEVHRRAASFSSQSGHEHRNENRLSHAGPSREWNRTRVREAVLQGVSPIVVDRGNGLNPETREYAAFAVEHGYTAELAEPDSLWWLELRVLLKYQDDISSELFDAWAQKLAAATRDGHRVPARTIRRWMTGWRYDLTVDEILNSQ